MAGKKRKKKKEPSVREAEKQRKEILDSIAKSKERLSECQLRFAGSPFGEAASALFETLSDVELFFKAPVQNEK